MDYRKHYNNLISRGIAREVEEGVYYEIHHIIPKSEGGSNDADNLVKLTAREHFIAHWLLYRESPDMPSRSFSFWRMCNGRGRVPSSKWIVISSRAYEEGKLAFRAAIVGTLRGRTKSKEHIEKIALANTGKRRTREAKDRMSLAAKNRPISKGFSKLRESRIIQDEKQKKQVLMILPDAKTVYKIFGSLKEAADFVNRDSSNLSVAIKKGKTSAGYYWKYLTTQDIYIKKEIKITNTKIMKFNGELSYCVHFDNSDESWIQIREVHSMIRDLAIKEGLEVVDMPTGGFIGEPYRDLGVITDRTPSEQLKKEAVELLSSKFRILTEEELDELI